MYSNKILFKFNIFKLNNTKLRYSAMFSVKIAIKVWHHLFLLWKWSAYFIGLS